MDLDFDDVNGEERFVAVGMTNRGRCLIVAWTLRGEAIRVVAAFDADQASQRLYFTARGL